MHVLQCIYADVNWELMYGINFFDKHISGEEIFISLYGAAIDYNIRLDKNTVKMENTFISCASQRFVKCNWLLPFN